MLEAWLAAERERFVLWLAVSMGIGILGYFALRAEPPLWLGWRCRRWRAACYWASIAWRAFAAAIAAGGRGAATAGTARPPGSDAAAGEDGYRSGGGVTTKNLISRDWMPRASLGMLVGSTAAGGHRFGTGKLMRVATHEGASTGPRISMPVIVITPDFVGC